MSRPCVISLGVGKNYRNGLIRQAAGLKANWYLGTVRHYDDYPEGCPTQKEVPYGFKPYLMDVARRDGFNPVLWMDAPCVPVKRLDRVFAEAANRGYMFQWSPNNTGEWCSDAAAAAQGLTRAQVNAMPRSFWATAMCLDFRHDVANEFMDKWLAASRDGKSFPGSRKNDDGSVSADPFVRGHRHDQAVASILSHKLNMPGHARLVAYDADSIMPMSDWTNAQLCQPGFPAFILCNHNCKFSEKEIYELMHWAANRDLYVANPGPERQRYLDDTGLNSHSFDGMKVLDVGSGPMGCLLAFDNCERHSLDPLADAYWSMQYPKWSGVEMHEAASEVMPFADASFDAVVCINALDHVDDLTKTALEIKRVLKHGGKLMIHAHYHPPTITEPISLNHAVMQQHFGWCLGLKKRQVFTKDCGRSVPAPGEEFWIWTNME